MRHAYICDYVRTPIGRYAGTLSTVRADDLGAAPLRALAERHPGLDLAAIDDVIFGCANQAGEDNRNVARMSLLLAGFPETVPGSTVNRLCGSGMDAVVSAARAIASGEAELMIAGGVESMSRAPFVVPKAETPFSRAGEMADTTIGWRLVNPQMKRLYGVDSMPETAENVAEMFGVSRDDQDHLPSAHSRRPDWPWRPAASPVRSGPWLCRRARGRPASSMPTSIPAHRPRSKPWRNCRRRSVPAAV